jgi:hypothetical protein
MKFRCEGTAMIYQERERGGGILTEATPYFCLECSFREVMSVSHGEHDQPRADEIGPVEKVVDNVLLCSDQLIQFVH